MFLRAIIAGLACAIPAAAADPLATRIDAILRDDTKRASFSAPADDGEFLRRATLDLAGSIPTADETRAFLADKSPDKRTKLVDRLLAAPTYATRMADAFHIHLMERLGDHADWTAYLRDAFAKNKPWDAMTREMLKGDVKGASFWLAKRLENYGENPVDYPGLAKDVGRLFLGKNLACAQCHDHLFVKDYKQADFQGIFAFVRNAYLVDAKTAAVAEKPTTGKVEFMSVFRKVPKQTGPALPGRKEFEPPPFKKGEEFAVKPDPKAKTNGTLKFSPLTLLAADLPTRDNADFAHNAVNRIWFLLMGRGLVHPLDLHHADNPPSHPKLLDLLATEFVSHRFDIKWLVREIALTEAYGRSSVLPDGVPVPVESFRTAIEKRLSAEQLLAAMQTALGVKTDAAVAAKFAKAFANPAREPEDEIAASLRGALFLLNDPVVLGWLTPKGGNLVERLIAMPDDAAIDEAYLAILTRPPTADERTTATAFLKKDRPAAMGRLVWALLASTEFGVNH